MSTTVTETETEPTTPPLKVSQSPAVATGRPRGWECDDGATSTAPQAPQAPQAPLPPASATRFDASPSDDEAPRSGKRSATSIALLMLPLCLSVLLSALDITIVTPAIPTIVGSLGSVAGYTWIGSAFILSSTATTPLWGTVADIWGRKPVILIAIVIFLGGSLLCALAPGMDALIAGRAVQGLGAAGMGTMVNVIICDSFSMRDRGLYLAVTSLVWALGSAIGPILGGLLTEKADWRWCFWINCGVVFFILLFFLKVSNPGTPIVAGLKKIDWLGSALVIGSVLMVLLALDFGDVVFPWSSATVICLIIFGVVAGGLFFVNEWKFAKEPIIPLYLFSRKSSVAAYGVYVCNFYTFIGLSYYLPLYSQSVLGANALDSGIELLPLIVACSFSAAFTGFFIQKTGKYLRIMYIGQFLNILGTGLFVYLPFEKSLARLFIFEILIGVGVGMNIEPPLIAVQAVNSERDTAAVVASMSFARSIANAVSIVVGGVIFQNEMTAANPGLVEQIGTELARQFNGDQASAKVNAISQLPGDQQVVVRQAYFYSLRDVWIMYVAFAGLSILLNIFVRAHHLSTENKGAVLGADREKIVGVDPNMELRESQRQRTSETTPTS
ncbi:major facilitator superfamily domain-containing protein [Xylariaceae sp. FL0662B]|nr:major facilitator superfamily domain-containing protein [Xylariaceae sp. FL0662B]